MPNWRLAKSLAVLRNQINEARPNRSKVADGTVGDLAHSNRKSDHNPNKKGVVNAIDLSHDPRGGFDSYEFAEHLRSCRDSRISYVISNGRIFSSTTKPWVWRKYTGPNKHDHHVHVSVIDNPKKYDDESDWDIGLGPQQEEVEVAKTGISEGSAAGAAGSGGDAVYQMWDAVQSAPKSVLDSIIDAMKQPRFLLAAAVCAVCVFIYLQRRKQKAK